MQTPSRSVKRNCLRNFKQQQKRSSQKKKGGIIMRKRKRVVFSGRLGFRVAQVPVKKIKVRFDLLCRFFFLSRKTTMNVFGSP
jgi:hypothetical protein